MQSNNCLIDAFNQKANSTKNDNQSKMPLSGFGSMFKPGGQPNSANTISAENFKSFTNNSSSFPQSSFGDSSFSGTQSPSVGSTAPSYFNLQTQPTSPSSFNSSSFFGSNNSMPPPSSDLTPSSNFSFDTGNTSSDNANSLFNFNVNAKNFEMGNKSDSLMEDKDAKQSFGGDGAQLASYFDQSMTFGKNSSEKPAFASPSFGFTADGSSPNYFSEMGDEEKEQPKEEDEKKDIPFGFGFSSAENQTKDFGKLPTESPWNSQPPSSDINITKKDDFFSTLKEFSPASPDDPPSSIEPKSFTDDLTNYGFKASFDGTIETPEREKPSGRKEGETKDEEASRPLMERLRTDGRSLCRWEVEQIKAEKFSFVPLSFPTERVLDL